MIWPRRKTRQPQRDLPEGYLILLGIDPHTGQHLTALWKATRNGLYIEFNSIAVIKAVAHTDQAVQDLTDLAWKDQP